MQTLFFTKHLNVVQVLFGPESQETDSDREFFFLIHTVISLTLIQTVDSSKFYEIYSNTVLVFPFSCFALRVQKLVGL